MRRLHPPHQRRRHALVRSQPASQQFVPFLHRSCTVRWVEDRLLIGSSSREETTRRNEPEAERQLLDGAIAGGFWLVLLLVIVGTILVLIIHLVRELVAALRAQARSRQNPTQHWQELPD